MPRHLILLFMGVVLRCGAQETKMEIHGHRGFRGHYPENTITAFKEAVKLGVDYIELDVVISKDSEVVVSHEPWFNSAICSDPLGKPVKRTRQRNIYRMNYEEIRKYDCGKRGHKGFPKQQKVAEYKPLLSEVIEVIESYIQQNGLKPVGYNIEIKSHQLGDRKYHPSPAVVARLVLDELRRFNINTRIMIQSFDPRCLAEIHERDPSVRIGLLVMNRRSVKLNIKKLGFTPYAYNPPARLCKKTLVNQAHQLNCKVMVWTVNDLHLMQKLKDKGVDALITDYPDIAIKLKVIPH